MKRILIADDDESIRMLYAEEFIEEGYEVITCGDGSQLIELIEAACPDLVVMDIRLGTYNGLDLLREIRNNNDHLPVILCTAYHAVKCDLRSIAADSVVVKSSDLKELKIAIKNVAEERIQSTQTSTGRKACKNG